MLDVELAASKLNLHSSSKIKLITITGGRNVPRAFRGTINIPSSCPLKMHLDIISTWFVSF